MVDVEVHGKVVGMSKRSSDNIRTLRIDCAPGTSLTALEPLEDVDIVISLPKQPIGPVAAPEASTPYERLCIAQNAVQKAAHALDRAWAEYEESLDAERVAMTHQGVPNATIIQAAQEPDLPGMYAAEQAEAAFGVVSEACSSCDLAEDACPYHDKSECLAYVEWKTGAPDED